jgi:hypothetical protein
MKKILIFLTFLLSVNLCIAQDTFVRKYTSYITEIDDKLSEWKEIDLTVVFNEKNTNNVVLYYPDKTITFYKIGGVEKDKTKGGHEYQLIECIDDDGTKVSLQLFAEAMRILLGGGYIEFHE